jgi:peptide/nickel transport system permease protein
MENSNRRSSPESDANTGDEAPELSGLALADVQLAPARKSRASAWQRFRSHRLAVLGTVMLLFLTVTSILAPVISGIPPTAIDITATRNPPSLDHPLGTDGGGRDVLSRLLHAGRISLSVGLVAVSIYTSIGLILGALAGYYGGWIDSTIMRLADVVLSFPTLLIIITLVSVMGPSIYNIMFAIGLLGWPEIARLLRGNLLTLRERDFVLAARATGATNQRIILRHLIPNAVAPIIVAATFGIASAILLEAALSFLGLGVQPPTPSWGNMLNDAQSLTVLESMPWLWVPAGAMIAIAVLSINFIGDGLRDALDPHLIR